MYRLIGLAVLAFAGSASAPVYGLATIAPGYGDDAGKEAGLWRGAT